MALIEHYLALKQLHVALAATSVGLFAVRGVGVLARARWPMAPSLRHLSVAIDTLLISAGGTLWWVLHLHPVRDRWLAAKLALIVLYIVLGSLALKRAPTRSTRGLAFVASLACIGVVAAIALTHDAGVLSRLFIGPG
jgi:uncharacterized membrane protein SirB2